MKTNRTVHRGLYRCQCKAIVFWNWYLRILSSAATYCLNIFVGYNLHQGAFNSSSPTQRKNVLTASIRRWLSDPSFDSKQPNRVSRAINARAEIRKENLLLQMHKINTDGCNGSAYIPTTTCVLRLKSPSVFLSNHFLYYVFCKEKHFKKEKKWEDTYK